MQMLRLQADQRIAAKTALEKRCNDILARANDIKNKDKIAEEDEAVIAKICRDTIEWIEKNPFASIYEITEKQTSVETKYKQIELELNLGVTDGNNFETYVYYIKQRISDDKISGKLSATDKRLIDDAIEKAIRLIDSRPLAEALEKERTDFDAVWVPISEKINFSETQTDVQIGGQVATENEQLTGGPSEEPQDGPTINEID